MYMYVFVSVCVYMPQCMYRYEKTNFRSQFNYMVFQGLNSDHPSGLAAGALTLWTISLAPIISHCVPL